MKKLKPQEAIQKAQQIADKYTCSYGGFNAERILKLAWEKVRAKNKLLKEKYGDRKRT